MKAHPPYKITHVFIDKQQSLLNIELSSEGNYLVFWWKNIPLGDVFLAPEEKPAGADFVEAFIKAINPTLSFYISGNSSVAPADWQQLVRDQHMAAFAAWLDNLLTPWITTEVPDKVPVSVVICTRNRAKDLHTCLRMLQNLACHPAEIIVVDNAPTDASTQEVVEQFAGVTYVKEPRPGLDIARNTGVKSANTPLVAFVDDDVEVDPLWVFKVWEGFQDPSTAAMTGLVIAVELETEAQFLFERFWGFNRGYIDKVYNKAYFDQTLSYGPPIWEIGAGANMAFRKSVFEEAGYFDELLDVGAAGCNGDSEMWFRILAKGHTIRYNPRAVVFHKHRKDLEALNRQLFFYMRGHAAAALIQQRQCQTAGYRTYLFWELPKWYFKLLFKGFPRYDFRYSLLRSEITGLGSGVLYYFKTRKKQI